MTKAYTFITAALDDVVVDYGGAAGGIGEIGGLNAWAVRLGSSGGFVANIDALNAIAIIVGASGGYLSNIDALNAISLRLGGTGNYRSELAALNEIADLATFSVSGPRLSGSHSQAEGTAIATAIGTLSVVGGTGTYTFTKTADPDSAFTLAAGVLKNAIVFDYEAAATHSVTLHADNGAGSTFDLTVNIAVTDVSAPTLSAATDTTTGSSTATLGVTTNGADGTLYAVVTTSATNPTAAQVKAGQDHAGAAAAFAGSQAISSSGAKTVNATGLSASTAYFAHFMHEGLPAEKSAVLAADGFTTNAAPAPANTVAPAITGTETVGSTLSCSTGTWTNSPTSYAYQWYRAVTSGGSIVTSGGLMVGVAISGATSSTYLLDAADEGEFIFCEVTATNAGGAAMAQSNATALIASGEDALTTAWVSAVVSDGGSVSSGRRTTVNTLIAGLRADGLISKIDRLWIFAAENQKSSLRDLISASLATNYDAATFPASGGTFTADSGWADAGSVNNYIDTGFNPTTAPSPHFTQNSAHLSIWSLTNTDITAAAVGVKAGSALGLNIYPKLGGNCYLRINDNPEAAGQTISDSRGHLLGNRSSATARQGYQNAGSLGSYGSTASQAPINGNIVCLSLDGVVGDSSPFQLAMLSIGGSLTSGEVTSFYNRLRTYMTAVGVP